MAGKQNNINHIGVVVDGSGSMSSYESAVRKVIDALVQQLAAQSQQLDQETRFTVYTFDTDVQCTVYDKDVLRMPKGADVYTCGHRQTALIDATMQAITEMEETSQRYGDHAFLLYVLTDGYENASRRFNSVMLQNKLAQLPNNWTVGALVPDFSSVATAKQWGFPAGNVATWNTTSAAGVEEVGEVIKQSAASYMTARTTGTRSTKNLFDLSHIDAKAVKASGLKPMQASKYQIIPVIPKHCDQQNSKGDPVVEISTFVERAGHKYVTGSTYYQLMKSTRIQANKEVIVVERKTNKAFTGKDARKLVGLPDVEATINPGKNKDYAVFVQSTSLNRHLVPGQQILLML